MKSKTKKIVLIVIISVLVLALITGGAALLYIRHQIKKVTDGHLYKIGTSIENLLNNGKTFQFNFTNTINSPDGIDIIIYEGDVEIDPKNKDISLSAQYSKISSDEFIKQSHIIKNDTLIILDEQNRFIDSYDIKNYTNTLFTVLGEFEGSSEEIKSISQAKNIISVDWRNIFNNLAGEITDYFISYDKFGECINTLFINYNDTEYLENHLIDLKNTYINDISTYTFVIPATTTLIDIEETMKSSIGTLLAVYSTDKLYETTNKLGFIDLSISTSNKYLNNVVIEYKKDNQNIIHSLSISDIGKAKISQDTIDLAYQLYLDNK